LNLLHERFKLRNLNRRERFKLRKLNHRRLIGKCEGVSLSRTMPSVLSSGPS
jgi:hypothetical protein